MFRRSKSKDLFVKASQKVISELQQQYYGPIGKPWITYWEMKAIFLQANLQNMCGTPLRLLSLGTPFLGPSLVSSPLTARLWLNENLRNVSIVKLFVYVVVPKIRVKS